MNFSSDNDIYKCAVVDIGANSVRMNIYDISDAGEFSVCDSSRSMLGLAGYAENGELTPDGEGKLLTVMREFLAQANSYPCDNFIAFATASLRGLQNSGKVIARIKQKLGVSIEIISGDYEAALDFEAIKYRFGADMAKDGIVIDMGGGSTEIIKFKNNSVSDLASINLGCLMLYKKFVKKPKEAPFPDETELPYIISYTKNTLEYQPEFKGTGGYAYLIGGTARALAKLHAAIFENTAQIDGYSFPITDIERIKDIIITDIKTGGNLIRKVASDRLTSIVPGLFAYSEIFKYTGIKQAIISCSGVREGYLLEFILRNFPRKTQEF